MNDGRLLNEKLRRALATGEVPYQANRRALKAVDGRGDIQQGTREVNLVLAGIDMFIEDLEDFANAAERVSHAAAISR